MHKLISHIYDEWFLSEPALHAILCTHEMSENASMTCAMRTGCGRIEYNPSLIETMTFDTLEQTLRAEVIRIMLKHPYQRQPIGISRDILTIASNIVLTNGYAFTALSLDKAEANRLPKTEYYEWYARELSGRDKNNNPDDGRGDDNLNDSKSESRSSESETRKALSEQSEMWQDDELAASSITKVIQGITRWGSISQRLVDEITAEKRSRTDFRRVLDTFRKSLVSQQRYLTRMRPNRRTDFMQMGSRYMQYARLLVAVDTSGSIRDEELARFYGIINSLFRYGVEQIDTVQFDTDLGEIVPFRKAKAKIAVVGRGGTSFQPVIDLASRTREYDGMLILTDGCAAEPTIPHDMQTRILWVLTREAHNDTRSWLSSQKTLTLPSL